MPLQDGRQYALMGWPSICPYRIAVNYALIGGQSNMPLQDGRQYAIIGWPSICPYRMAVNMPL